MTERYTCVILLVVAMAAALPSDLSSQVLVPSSQVREALSILFEPLASLGSVEGPGSLVGPPSQVSVDGRGRYWVVDGSSPPMVFDAAGVFMDIVGREGAGPGEFRGAVAVATAGPDSVLVVDQHLQRVTVVGPDLVPRRTISSLPLSIFRAEIVSWPDTVVVNGLSFSPDLVGWPLHRISLGGDAIAILDSFGANEGEVRNAHAATDLFTRLATPYEGTVWTGEDHAYSLAEWGPGTRPLRQFERRPDWFAERTTNSLGTPSTPPSPRIASVERDRDGLVWVFFHVPSPTWRDAWPEDALEATEILPTRIQADRLYRTRVEVLDVDAEEVVASAVIDGLVITALADRRVAIYRETEDGIPRIDIVEARLERR